ncbi:DOT5 [Candida metapsilosis]|uniref:DOT5 n=1 Tax=Candida metapsilosis TaxID=273372 RepID=A0A8H8DAQ6_9ASCO|nr:DOT5 [Candida metapsilosis]
MSGLRRSARVASNSKAKADEPATATTTAPPPTKKAKTEPKVAEPEPETNEIEIGEKIPDITLLNQDEKEVNLPTIAQTHKQVCGFQKNFQFLNDQNVAVFGLSADTPANQKNFQTKQHVEYDLLSDPKRELIGILGAKKQPTGIKRSHWIFVDGVLKVKKLQISPEQSVDGAKEEIEQFIAEANGGGEVKGEASTAPAGNGDEAKPVVNDVESVPAATTEPVDALKTEVKPSSEDGAAAAEEKKGQEQKDNSLLTSEQAPQVATEATTTTI